MSDKVKLTKAQREALSKAARRDTGVWHPEGSGQFQMAKRLEALGLGRFAAGIGRFEINDAGRRVVQGEASHGQ